jgi:hypothetical protein
LTANAPPGPAADQGALVGRHRRHDAAHQLVLGAIAVRDPVGGPDRGAVPLVKALDQCVREHVASEAISSSHDQQPGAIGPQRLRCREQPGPLLQLGRA